MIWFSSDFHFSHSNICYRVSKWPDKEKSTRKFDTLHEMNEAIIDAINSHVMQDDTLYFLGDWSFGGIENIWNLRKRIICKNIHFIMGNHDHHIKKDKKLPNCWYDNYGNFTSDKNEKGISPDNEEDFSIIYANHLFSSVLNYFEGYIGDQLFVLSHYPMEEWFEMDRKGAIMLHGHCHHNIDNCDINRMYKRMDIGLDWEEFRPYSIDEITRKMNKRLNKKHIE